MEDEHNYEEIDRDITRSMFSADKHCNLRKTRTEPWSQAIGLANTIRYWDVLVKQKGDYNPMTGMLNYYLSLSDIEV
jgi:hypothetical protein